jgi:sigma-54 dependent transcriptional regulator, acetoin dehydrogenase operon transcriptional activator AcoR
VVPLWLPPLRERRNDIPLLVEHCLHRILESTGRGPVTVSPEALDVLLSHDWPGNVRELQNWIQFALVKCKDGVIRPAHLPPQRPGPGSPRPLRNLRRRKLDAESVREALAKTHNNKVAAAELLDVSRATLYRFLDHHGM